MSTYTIGLDYGTESARAILVDTASGEIVATATHRYAHGVIDERLPGSDLPLPPDYALQHPADWLAALEVTIPSLLRQSGVQASHLVGIGLDFTACTVLPVTADGSPLCQYPEERSRPHAWPKLWKHHASQPQADRVNDLARRRQERWLPRYGGKISAEWLLPKALELLEEAPDLYARAAYLVEGMDWVVWQLTGTLARNACAAGYKATWHKIDGYPTADFLATLHPDLVDLYTNKLAGQVVSPGRCVGSLTETWAARLGIEAGTAIAAGIIDAHAAAIGAGAVKAGSFFMVMGTSTCQMLVSEEEMQVEGISGLVEDGIVPGLYGYEAGQASVGDIFAWYVEHSVPPAYHQEASARGIDLHQLLSEQAARLQPGESGLLALDWWNGCRSTLVDADLNGLILGLTLSTKPEHIYRALIEATAYGTRLILESFTAKGVPIQTIGAGGGLTRNNTLMQIYADVSGREIAVTSSEQVAALGAAMLGAVAAGKTSGGHDTIEQAVAHMAPPPATVFRPIPAHVDRYDTLYQEYRRLYDYFGRGENEVMKTLRRLRR